MTDTLKRWVAERRRIAEAAAAAFRSPDEPMTLDEYEVNKEASRALLADARNSMSIQLQIIEIQERAIGYALSGMSKCDCAPEDDGRCRGCISTQAVDEARAAIEALLKEEGKE